MEYLFAGLVVAFFCIWCYRRGVKDGMAIKKGKQPEPIQNPITQIVDSHEQAKKRSEEHDATKSLEEQFQAFVNYQPKYTGDKE